MQRTPDYDAKEATFKLPPGWRLVVTSPSVVFVRDQGEQPEPQPVSTIGACPFCETVPCTDHAHRLWRLGLNGADT